MTTNRISLELALKAFSATGIRPRVGRLFCKETNEACLVGAIAIYLGKGPIPNIITLLHKFSCQYLLGVIAGFDGRQSEPYVSLLDYELGFKDGKAARNVLL